MGEALTEVTKMTMTTMVESIASVVVNGQPVTDRVQINDFITNIDRTMYGKIRDHLTEIRQTGEMKPLSITCKDCEHQFEQPFTLDMTNFFV